MIPVTVQCGCGQRFAFDVEPVDGRMPTAVACPACGADATGAADLIIAAALAAPAEAVPSSVMKMRVAAPHVPVAPEPAPPAPPARPVPAPAASPAKLAWYEQVWIGLPFVLIPIGGLIGGLVGGAAWGINQTIFKKVQGTALRYVLTGLVTLVAGVVWLVTAASVARWMRKV